MVGLGMFKAGSIAIYIQLAGEGDFRSERGDVTIDGRMTPRISNRNTRFGRRGHASVQRLYVFSELPFVRLYASSTKGPIVSLKTLK
jgi:hypothetical protein